MGTNKYSTFLGLTRAFHKIDGRGYCSDIKLILDTFTTIPCKEPAKRTQTEGKYMTHFLGPDQYFIWISKQFFFPPNKFRIANTISIQRKILTKGNLLKVHPVNNTAIFLHSNVSFNGTLYCPDKHNINFSIHPLQKEIVLPLILIPLECYFNSVFLNISSFKIIHLDDKRIRNISENFVFNTGLTFNHTIKSIEQAKLITEQQLHREIENISTLKCQIINKERENLNGGFLEGFLNFFKDGVNKILYIVLSVIVLVLMIVMIICLAKFGCFCKKSS